MGFLDDFAGGQEFLGSKDFPNTILGHQMCNKAPTKGPKNFTCSKIGTFGYLGVIAQNERLLGGNIVQYHTIMGETLVINGGGWSMSVASLSLIPHRYKYLPATPYDTCSIPGAASIIL